MSGNEPQPPVLVDARPLLKASALHLLAWSVVAALIFLVDPVMAKSVLAGAAIAVLPAAWSAWSVFRFRKGMAPREAVRVVNRGALDKLLLTCLLFAFVFVEAQPVSAGALFTAFVAALALQGWLTARVLLRH